MLTKWTRQPWTSSFNHHTLALQSAFESPYSGIHNIEWFNWLAMPIPEYCEWHIFQTFCTRWQNAQNEMQCMIAWSFFLCHSWFTTAKKKVNFIGDNEIKKFDAVISVWTERTDRHLLVRHMNFPAPFWSNSWSCGWENSLKCDKISLSKLNKITVWGKI